MPPKLKYFEIVVMSEFLGGIFPSFFGGTIRSGCVCKQPRAKIGTRHEAKFTSLAFGLTQSNKVMHEMFPSRTSVPSSFGGHHHESK